MVRLVLKDVSFCQFSRPRLSLPADRESQTVDRYNILLFYSISLFAAPLHFSWQNKGTFRTWQKQILWSRICMDFIFLILLPFFLISLFFYPAFKFVLFFFNILALFYSYLLDFCYLLIENHFKFTKIYPLFYLVAV